MGIYLSFALSNSVTKKEWEKVYEESLYLAQKLDLADFTTITYKGITPYCFCKVKEHQKSYDDETDPHWCASADYSFMKEAEEFWVCRNHDNTKYDKNAGPAILRVLPIFTNHDLSEPICNQGKDFWGDKTQGYLYHAYLLGIVCMMETRLKEKVFIYGDITKEHCEIAVEFVNKYAKEPVELPARCDFKRLYDIVKNLKISEEDKLLLMIKTYLGDLDFDCGELIRINFDKNNVFLFWKNRFTINKDNIFNLTDTLTNYLSLGFDFNEIGKYIPLDETKTCINLLWAIIDVSNKRNQFINISKEQLLSEFSKLIGNKINIDEEILKKEEHFKEFNNDSLIKQLNSIKNNIKEQNKKYLEIKDNYDINQSEYLIYYEKGNSILPNLLKCVKNAKDFITKALEEKEYKELLKESYVKQINTLIEMNPWFPVRDIDWMHAIDYFETHKDALSRYYPLFRMEINYETPYRGIAQALFLNDEFYEFARKI